VHAGQPQIITQKFDASLRCRALNHWAVNFIAHGYKESGKLTKHAPLFKGVSFMDFKGKTRNALKSFKDKTVKFPYCFVKINKEGMRPKINKGFFAPSIFLEKI
jgi:hypothetical protein